MKDKVTLTDADWDLLLPETPHMLGKSELQLRPITLEEIALLMNVITDSKDYFLANDITTDNYHQPLQLIAITKLFIDKLPGIISDCSQLAESDVKGLPLEPAINLVRKLIAINEKAKDGLVKNLTALAEEVQTLMSGVSETSSNSSSKKDTTGKK